MLATNKLNLLLPAFLVADSSTLKAFSPEQLQVLSTHAINTYGHGFGMGLIFLGWACLVRGYPIYQSEYIPKIFGILLVLAGLNRIPTGSWFGVRPETISPSKIDSHTTKNLNRRVFFRCHSLMAKDYDGIELKARPYRIK